MKSFKKASWLQLFPNNYSLTGACWYLITQTIKTLLLEEEKSPSSLSARHPARIIFMVIGCVAERKHSKRFRRAVDPQQSLAAEPSRKTLENSLKDVGPEMLCLQKEALCVQYWKPGNRFILLMSYSLLHLWTCLKTSYIAAYSQGCMIAQVIAGSINKRIHPERC